MTVVCSCVGVNTSSQAIENARYFAFTNGTYLAADITEASSLHPNVKVANPYLIGIQETVNRLTGEVSVQKQYLLQETSLGFSRGIVKFTREMSTSENGETTVSIEGSVQGGFDSDSTIDAIEDDFKGYDWYSIAQDLYSSYTTEDDPFRSINKFAAGRTGSNNDKLIFSTKDHSTPNYVRNPNCWLYPLDLTGISVWNSSGGSSLGDVDTGGGAAISPRHVVFADHYIIADGATMRWVTKNNEVITRTLVTSAKVGATDLRIGVLDSDLPDSICFYKVLPSGWGSTKLATGLHVVMTDQEEKIFPRQFNDGTYISAVPVWSAPTTSPLSLLTETPVSGDSGNPVFLIINNELVILGGIFTNASCVNLSYYFSASNAVMATLGGGYQLTEIDVNVLSNPPLYTSPTNFSLTRNPNANLINFSLDYSNKKNNDIYIIDKTTIINNYEDSTKCIDVSVSILSDLKNSEARWNAVYNYYVTFDIAQFAQSKWTKYGNTDTLNFNVKDSSYAENRQIGSIEASARFCTSVGQDCGCLQNMDYSCNFIPALNEYKVGIPVDGEGCHFIEDLMVLKRASFSIQGRVIPSICCSYAKAVFELKNRVNQISNLLFYGKDKILDSAEISNKNPAGEISFNFSWSAKKDSIIPENLL
jgi:hypothetical protein